MQEMHEIQKWPAEHSQNYFNPSIITLLEENDPIRGEWPLWDKNLVHHTDAYVTGEITLQGMQVYLTQLSFV